MTVPQPIDELKEMDRKAQRVLEGNRRARTVTMPYAAVRRWALHCTAPVMHHSDLWAPLTPRPSLPRELL